MPHPAESWSSSLDLISEEQRDVIENILSEVRKACLQVAPLNEVQDAIVHARIRFGEILDTLPSDIEDVLDLCEGLIEAIYAQRENIMKSVEQGFPLDSPNFIESRIRLLLAPKFGLNDEEIGILEKYLYKNIKELHTL